LKKVIFQKGSFSKRALFKRSFSKRPLFKRALFNGLFSKGPCPTVPSQRAPFSTARSNGLLKRVLGLFRAGPLKSLH